MVKVTSMQRQKLLPEAVRKWSNMPSVKAASPSLASEDATIHFC